MLSSTESVDVFIIVFVPSTVRSPTLRCSILPVDPLILSASVVVPPSFTVKIISLSCVVCAIVKSSLESDIVMSDPTPIVTPVSLSTPNEPDVVSLAFDLR